MLTRIGSLNLIHLSPHLSLLSTIKNVVTTKDLIFKCNFSEFYPKTLSSIYILFVSKHIHNIVLLLSSRFYLYN